MIFLKKKLVEYAAISSVILLIFGLILNPTVGRQGTFLGLQICGSVIIPSLFPFTFLSLFLVKIRTTETSEKWDKITLFLLGINADEFVIFLLSLIGGFPLSAKLLNEQVREGKMAEKRAERLIAAFINPGPAFCVSVVGIGIFSSKEIGLILYFSSILSSAIFLQILRFFGPSKSQKIPLNKGNVSISSNFVLSAYETKNAIVSICVFVIFFSFIISYLDFFSQHFEVLSKIAILLEITNAVTRCENLYIIAFLLGFAGVSIWLQIFSIAQDFKIGKTVFVLSRISSGLLISLFTKLSVKIFGVVITTSKGIYMSYGNLFENPLLCISLLFMVIVFLISVTSKNSAWKLREDVV